MSGMSLVRQIFAAVTTSDSPTSMCQSLDDALRGYDPSYPRRHPPFRDAAYEVARNKDRIDREFGGTGMTTLLVATLAVGDVADAWRGFPRSDRLDAVLEELLKTTQRYAKRKTE